MIVNAGQYGIFEAFDGDAIAKTILRDGFWEKHLTDKVANLVKEDFNIIDCGANFGYLSVQFSRMTKGKVFAFEPLQPVFGQLIKNIGHNKCPNIVPINAAVGDVNKLIEMNRVNYYDNWVNIGDTSVGSGGDCVPMLKLDDFFSDIKIDLIKLDIQGSEEIALMGMKDLIKKNKPYILIEIERNVKTLIDYIYNILNYKLELINSSYPVDYLATPK